MENLNWFVLEVLMQQRLREQLAQPYRPAAPVPPAAGRGGVRRALASTLVRLGLRLDPAAGEGLAAFDLTLAHSEGGGA